MVILKDIKVTTKTNVSNVLLVLGFFKKTRKNFWIAANSLSPYGVIKRFFR